MIQVLSTGRTVWSCPTALGTRRGPKIKMKDCKKTNIVQRFVAHNGYLSTQASPFQRSTSNLRFGECLHAVLLLASRRRWLGARVCPCPRVTRSPHSSSASGAIGALRKQCSYPSWERLLKRPADRNQEAKRAQVEAGGSAEQLACEWNAPLPGARRGQQGRPP